MTNFEPTLATRLAALKALPEGWMDGDGQPVSEAALKQTANLLQPPSRLQEKCSLHAMPDGGVLIEMDPGYKFNVAVGADGDITVDVSEGQGSSRLYKGSATDTIVFNEARSAIRDLITFHLDELVLKEQKADADTEQIARLSSIVTGLLPYANFHLRTPGSTGSKLQKAIRQEVPSWRNPPEDAPLPIDVTSYFYVQNEAVAGIGAIKDRPAIMTRIQDGMEDFEFIVACIPQDVMEQFENDEFDLRDVILHAETQLYTSDGPYQEDDGPVIATPFHGVVHEYMLCSPGLFDADLRQTCIVENLKTEEESPNP